MIPSTNLKPSGQQPRGRFITTYSRDYRPFSERCLQVSSCKAEAADPAAGSAASIHPLQAKPATWSISYQYVDKTTNSTYGSATCFQTPSCSLFPASPSPFGILAPSIFEGRTQEVRVARETMHLRGEEEKEDVLEQQEGKDELQQKIDVLCEKDKIVISSRVDPACCEDFLRSLCREAELQCLANLPSPSSPIITKNVAANCDYLRGLTLAANLKSSAFPQATSWQCICCEWETEHQNSCCFEMQICPCHISQGGNLPLACVPPTIYSTEYQSSYAAKGTPVQKSPSGVNKMTKPLSPNSNKITKNDFMLYNPPGGHSYWLHQGAIRQLWSSIV